MIPSLASSGFGRRVRRRAAGLGWGAAMLPLGLVLVACNWGTAEPYLAGAPLEPLQPVSTAPLNEATEVPVTVTPTVSWNDRVHPSALDSSGVALRAGETTLVATPRVDLLDCTVVVRPLTPLAPNTLHTATFQGLRGFGTGEQLGSEVLSFTTGDGTSPTSPRPVPSFGEMPRGDPRPPLRLLPRRPPASRGARPLQPRARRAGAAGGSHHETPGGVLCGAGRPRIELSVVEAPRPARHCGAGHAPLGLLPRGPRLPDARPWPAPGRGLGGHSCPLGSGRGGSRGAATGFNGRAKRPPPGRSDEQRLHWWVDPGAGSSSGAQARGSRGWRPAPLGKVGQRRVGRREWEAQ